MMILFAIALLIGLIGALSFNLIYWQRLQAIAASAPRIQPHHSTSTVLPTSSEKLSTSSLQVDSDQVSDNKSDLVKLSVIIPVYNESNNVEACVQSVLQSSTWGGDRLEVWVVDDQSTDDTWARAQALQTRLQDPRLALLAGQPRPTDSIWMGKNWACHQAIQQATGDYLLFLDADVRLQPGSLETAIAQMESQTIDLMTCILTIICGCWAEWLAQPIIFGFIAASVPFADVNNPDSEAVFAAGPFMLFRRTAYDQLGGHRAVASQVVEDVELARRVKQKGLKLHYTIAHAIGDLRMYPTGSALWEGWTKNWYLGSQRNLQLTLYGAWMVFWICALPTLALAGLLLSGAIVGWTIFKLTAIAIALLTILLQYPLRQAIASITGIPPRYWWLIGVGGLYVVALILASIVKTETGWGWTWRGRSLQKPEAG